MSLTYSFYLFSIVMHPIESQKKKIAISYVIIDHSYDQLLIIGYDH